MKLTTKDVVLLHEGQQLRKKIISLYGSIEKFYEAEKTLGLSLKTIRNNCSYEKVVSNTLKLFISAKFDNGWDDVILTEIGQVQRFVSEIYTYIHLYKEDEDISTLEKVLELCNEYRLLNETALMYRCIAKYYYNRNDTQRTIALYYAGINILTEKYVDSLIILHAELAFHLFMERNTVDAEKHFNIAENYTKYTGIKAHSMYVYAYRRAVTLNSMGQYQKARDFYFIALNHASTNSEELSETGAALMAIGTTFRWECKYEEAKDYYFKALLYFHINDTNGRGIALNNLAEIFNINGDYKSAAKYMEEALNIIDKKNITNNLLACTETLADIRLKLGDASICLDYFELVKKTIDTSISKKKIINSICRMINILNSPVLLKELELTINYLIAHAANETYVDELYSCIGRLHIKQNDKEVFCEKNI